MRVKLSVERGEKKSPETLLNYAYKLHKPALVLSAVAFALCLVGIFLRLGTLANQVSFPFLEDSQLGRTYWILLLAANGMLMVLLATICVLGHTAEERSRRYNDMDDPESRARVLAKVQAAMAGLADPENVVARVEHGTALKDVSYVLQTNKDFGIRSFDDYERAMARLARARVIAETGDFFVKENGFPAEAARTEGETTTTR